MEPTFRLVMFGGLALLRDGDPVSGAVSQRKRLTLLGLLASTPAGVARDTALAMLWPDSDDERARNSLSQVIHGLRREIGDSIVRVVNGTLVMDSAVLASDVADFRSAVARGDHEAAVEFHRGPFLEGVYLRDAPEFERWCDGLRLELTRQYLSSLQFLAEGATRRGDWPAAVHWWRGCASADPLSGRVARRYMEALAADRKREDAIRHAEVHAEMLRAELGAEPDPGVVSLAAELRSARESPSAARGSSGPASSSAASSLVVANDPDCVTDASEQTRLSLPPGRRSLGARALTNRQVRYAAIATLASSAGVFAAVRLTRSPIYDDRRVVVAAFENRTGDASLESLGFLAADWIAQGLQRTNLTSVVDPATALLASRYTRSEHVPLGDVREIRAMASETRARLVVTGSYYRDRDTLVVVARISDARDEKLLDAPTPVRVALNTPASAIEPLRERVLGALAMRLDERLDPIVPPGSSPPPTFAAYQNYMLGIAAWQRRDGQAAIEFQSKASAEDSTFALPLIWKVWAVGSRSRSADSILKRLESMREQLAPLDRIAIDYQRASARVDLRAQRIAAEQAVRLAPGSHWEYNLGFTLTQMGRFKEAVSAYEQIDRGKGWTRGWETFWERFTVALHLAGNHERELEIAREAHRVLPSSSGPIYLEARALAAMGRVDELDRAIEDLKAYKENADSLGFFLSLLAREVETSGDTVGARVLHDRAVSWFATRPSQELELPPRQLQLGMALYRGGKYREARPVFEKLVKDPSRNQRSANVDPHAYLGGVYAYLGDRARADSVIEVLLADQRPGAANYALHWSARIAAAMGDKDRAVEYLRRQIAISGFGASFHYDNRDLDGLMNYPPYLALPRVR